MKDLWIRRARPDETDTILALTSAAFGRADEGQIITKLAAEGASLYSLVAHNDRELIGHIQVFAIQVDGAELAAGIGPVSVPSSQQRRGIGSGLIKLSLQLVEGSNRVLCFVLGDPNYYSRFGFSSETAAAFKAPWGGPEFMAKRFAGTPTFGTLTYPSAFTPS